MSVYLHFGYEVQEVTVPVNIELAQLIKKLKEKTGCSDFAKVEEFDEDFQEWLAITEQEELYLFKGAKLKVTER